MIPGDADITNITEEQLTVEDILAEANKAPYRSLLEVWREVIKPAKTLKDQRITPQWANRILSGYHEITFADMPAYRDRYFTKVSHLGDILDVEIASDDECLNVMSPDEDTENNAGHYLNILTYWQQAFLLWEMAWDPAEPSAGIELAAISEVHRMFFDEKGLASLLDQISFQVTDADRDAMAQALAETQQALEEK